MKSVSHRQPCPPSFGRDIIRRRRVKKKENRKEILESVSSGVSERNIRKERKLKKKRERVSQKTRMREERNG